VKEVKQLDVDGDVNIMKKIIVLMVLIFSLNINAQQRQRQPKDKCISTSIIENRENVFVTKKNKCTNTKTTKVYTIEEWKKLLEKRRKEALKRRKK
jgi:hypothetical protein